MLVGSQKVYGSQMFLRGARGWCPAEIRHATFFGEGLQQRRAWESSTDMWSKDQMSTIPEDGPNVECQMMECRSKDGEKRFDIIVFLYKPSKIATSRARDANKKSRETSVKKHLARTGVQTNKEK